MSESPRSTVRAIPLSMVRSGREVTEPRPSPDGELVAFVQRVGSEAVITVVPAGGGPERMLACPVAPSPGRGLGGGCLAWLPSGDGVVVAAADGEIWQVGLDGFARRVTGVGRTCRAPVVDARGDFLVAVVDEAEVWRVPLQADGIADPERLDDATDDFCFDPAIAPDSTTVVWQAWSAPDMPWDGAARVRVGLVDGRVAHRSRWKPDGGAVQQPRFAPDGTESCVHDGDGWLNVALAGEILVPEPFEHAGPTWGMGQRSYAVSPDAGRVAFARNEDGFGRLCVADVRSGRVDTLARGVHGQIEWVGERITALRTGARTPTRIVSYEPPTAARTVLAVGPSEAWDHWDLPEPEPLAVGDGPDTVHARRYGSTGDRLICWVHGGPTDQWMVEFDPRVAYWWSRGWDVLVVDPRGSTGHGRAYQRALNGAWGRLDVDDTAALVRAAHERGWGSSSTTVIAGGSAGGLTVLGALADHGELFAAGVAAYPVADLSTLAEATHRFEAHYTDTLVGPAADVALFRALSPIERADRIRVPLLVFHGTDDPVVPVDQSRRLVEVVRRAGGTVELVELDGAGHGFRDPEHVRTYYETMEKFLEDAVTRGPGHR